MKSKSILFALFLSSPIFGAPCQVFQSQGGVVTEINDPLFAALSASDTCPTSVITFRQNLTANGLHSTPTMVANRGFHNPNRGSFSIFESVSGHINGHDFTDKELTFGHFTTARGNTLDLASGNGLIIEAIAWDKVKELYNFYELIGTPSGRFWFYRGDSADIAADTANLHLGEPAFGQKLRCSGCHVSGGPIMKELSAPHNAWWTEENGLPFGGRQISQELANIVAKLVNPSHLQEIVEQGNQTLWQGKGWHDIQKKQNLRQMLRPLFCSNEINLASSTQRLLAARQENLRIPDGFFVDPWWQATGNLQIPAKSYYSALEGLNSRFPENGFLDADHAWLTPVRSFADTSLIKHLITSGIVTQEFVADILAIDFTRPLFSQTRCELLTLVPTSSHNWQNELLAASASSALPGAKQLHSYLSQANSAPVHRANVQQYLDDCRESQNVKAWLNALQERRMQVYDNIISTNPNGQILEPGFRVIFPQWHTTASAPTQLCAG